MERKGSSLAGNYCLTLSCVRRFTSITLCLRFYRFSANRTNRQLWKKAIEPTPPFCRMSSMTGQAATRQWAEQEIWGSQSLLVSSIRNSYSEQCHDARCAVRITLNCLPARFWVKWSYWTLTSNVKRTQDMNRIRGTLCPLFEPWFKFDAMFTLCLL